MTGFPWGEAMRLGLGVLRFSPRDFWAMTPRELMAARAGLFGVGETAPPDRAVLDTLMREHPDRDR